MTARWKLNFSEMEKGGSKLSDAGDSGAVETWMEWEVGKE